MGRMVPLGFEPHFSTGEVALLTTVIVGFGVLSALPATLVLASVGHSRAAYRPGWNAFWYWLWGTGLTLVALVGLLYLHLSWWSIPLSWPPALLLAWLLKPRGRRSRISETPAAS
jgi:hypothetical protein